MRQSHKLTEDQVAAIVAEAKREPYQRIADRYGINKTTVGYHVRKAAGKITPKSRTFTPSATPATAPPAPSPVVLKGVLKGLPAGGAK